MDWQWLKKMGKVVGNTAKGYGSSEVAITDKPVKNSGQTPIAQTTGVHLWVEFQQEVEERQQQIKLAQMKLQYIQQLPEQGFRKQIAKLNHPQAKELQEFIYRVQVAKINDSHQDFNVWRFEQEKQLQGELEEYRAQTQEEWQPISRIFQ